MESVELCPAVDEVLGGMGMGERRCYTVFKLWTVYSWLTSQFSLIQYIDVANLDFTAAQ